MGRDFYMATRFELGGQSVAPPASSDMTKESCPDAGITTFSRKPGLKPSFQRLVKLAKETKIYVVFDGEKRSKACVTLRPSNEALHVSGLVIVQGCNWRFNQSSELRSLRAVPQSAPYVEEVSESEPLNSSDSIVWKYCSISRDDECNSFGKYEPGTYSRVYLRRYNNTIDVSSLEYGDRMPGLP
jgi:hypothetical protein